ncbi:hypothetical protein NQU17_10945 [Clostridiaceae bacterium HFYG-1003]|nr:hypothetical protein NQU17_10945 [Clostridiaceae bacterium HFYG-1003]
MSRNYFLVRLKPGGIDRTEECLRDNKIALGWSKTGDIAEMSKDEVRDKMEAEYNYTGMALSGNLTSLMTLRDRIQIGDLVVTADGPNISVGEVKSEYYFDEDAAKEDYGHQRKVQWILKNIDRNDIPDELRQALRGQKATYQMKNVESTLELMVSPDFDTATLTAQKPKKKRGRPTKAESEARKALLEAEKAKNPPAAQFNPADAIFNENVRLVSQNYLLRPGDDDTESVWVRFSFPADTTKEEAARMAAFVSSCYYSEQPAPKPTEN